MQCCLRHLSPRQDTAWDRATRYLSDPLRFQRDVWPLWNLLFPLLNGAGTVRTGSPRTLRSVISCHASFRGVASRDALTGPPVCPTSTTAVPLLPSPQGMAVIRCGGEPETEADSEDSSSANPHRARTAVPPASPWLSPLRPSGSTALHGAASPSNAGDAGPWSDLGLQKKPQNPA